jgi:putative nucleotidyltransferase with HDIG domain
LEAVRSDGSEFPVELAIRGIEADGKLFSVGIVRDVTERVEQAKSLQEAFVETIGAMTATIATRDPYTADHQRKVSQLSSAIAEELGLSAEEIRGVQFGAMIHDIGKISVPAEILNRPGKLSDIEFQMIKAHAAVGTTIIGKIDFPWPIAEIVGEHHERIDGSGYPDGLKGTEISQEARIVAVADVVEAMSSHRPYRPSLGIEAALAEITENRGTSYDADAVDACLRLFAEDRFEFDTQ